MALRQEVALGRDGAPVVQAFRTDEGALVFRYLVVRAGGMGVWTQVSDAILRNANHIDKDEASLDQQLRAVALAVAASLGGDEAARLARIEELEAQLEAQAALLEDERAQNAELQKRLRGVERQGSRQRRPAGAGAAAA